MLERWPRSQRKVREAWQICDNAFVLRVQRSRRLDAGPKWILPHCRVCNAAAGNVLNNHFVHKLPRVGAVSVSTSVDRRLACRALEMLRLRADRWQFLVRVQIVGTAQVNCHPRFGFRRLCFVAVSFWRSREKNNECADGRVAQEAR